MFFEIYGLSRDEFVELMESYSDSFENFFVAAKEMYKDKDGLLKSRARRSDDFFVFIDEEFMNILAKINFEAFKRLSTEELILLDESIYHILYINDGITSNIVVGTLIKSISDAVNWYLDDEYIKKNAPEEILLEIDKSLQSYYGEVTEEDNKMYEELGIDPYELHVITEKEHDYIYSEYVKYVNVIKIVKEHFANIQSEILDFLVSPHTKEEKTDKVNQYNRVVDDMKKGIYHIGDEKIELADSSELYQRLNKDTMTNALDFYFDQQEISINSSIESVAHLFIGFHAFRLNKDDYNRDGFIESMKLFVDTNFRNSTYHASEDELKSKYDKLKSNIYWIYDLKYCYYRIYDFYLRYEKNIRSMNNENKLRDTQRNNFILSEKYTSNIEYHNKLNHIEKYYSYEMKQYEVIRENTIGKEKDEIIIKIKKRSEETNRLIFDNDTMDACNRIAVSLEAITLLKEFLSIILQQEEDEVCFEVSELCGMRDSLANIIYDIIGIIYFNPGLHQELKQKNKQDLAIIHNDEKHLGNLKMWRLMYEESLHAAINNDIEGLMELRRQYIQPFSVNNMPEEELEKVINGIISEIRKKVESQPEYIESYSNTKKYLEKYSGILSNDIIMTISTAEHLYNEYIVSREEMENFDYSCISILYYQALENAYNHLIYKPYVEKVIKPNLHDILYRLDNYRKYPCDTRGRGYWPDKSLIKLINYNNEVEASCMFGPFEKVMKYFAYNSNELFIFRDFLVKIFNTRTLDMERIRDFSRGLSDVVSRRNHAAHGGSTIRFKDVIDDKLYVYEKQKIERYKLLLNKLLQFFNV